MTDIWQRVRGAYAGEGFALPVGDLPGRARRGRRRRTALVSAGVAVLALTVGAAVALGAGHNAGTGPVAPPAADHPGEKGEAEFDSAAHQVPTTDEAVSDCLAIVEGMIGPDGPIPLARFSFVNEGQWFTLLINEAVTVRCFAPWQDGTDSYSVQSMTAVGETGDWSGDAGPPMFRHISSRSAGAEQSYVAGRASAGTSRVQVMLVDGAAVTAVLDGEWFVAWLPTATGRGSADIDTVVGYDSDGVLLWETAESGSR